MASIDVSSLSAVTFNGTSLDQITFNGVVVWSGTPSIGAEVANYAVTLVGAPYVYGAAGPNAFDTPGFIQYVFRQFGVSLGRTLDQQITQGTAVSSSTAMQGDVAFFRSTSAIATAYIYLGSGLWVGCLLNYGVVQRTQAQLTGTLAAIRRYV